MAEMGGASRVTHLHTLVALIVSLSASVPHPQRAPPPEPARKTRIKTGYQIQYSRRLHTLQSMQIKQVRVRPYYVIFRGNQSQQRPWLQARVENAPYKQTNERIFRAAL